MLYSFCSCSLSYTVTTWELQDSTLSEDIILIGANTQAIVKNLEIYRVFSSFILHYNVLHLLLNILVFAFFGQFVVRLLGTVRFLNIVLFSSMVAVLFSNVFSLADSSDASFGASGGAFGSIRCLHGYQIYASRKNSCAIEPHA